MVRSRAVVLVPSSLRPSCSLHIQSHVLSWPLRPYSFSFAYLLESGHLFLLCYFQNAWSLNIVKLPFPHEGWQRRKTKWNPQSERDTLKSFKSSSCSTSFSNPLTPRPAHKQHCLMVALPKRKETGQKTHDFTDQKSKQRFVKYCGGLNGNAEWECPIGSYISMFGPQLVDLFGKD
jgi:hypothetical protein